MGSKIIGWIIGAITLSVLLIGCTATLYFLGITTILGVRTNSIFFGIVAVLALFGVGFVALNAFGVFFDNNY